MNNQWMSSASRQALDRSLIGVAGRLGVVLFSVAFWTAVLMLLHIL